MIVSSKKAAVKFHSKLAVKQQYVEYSISKKLNDIVLVKPVTIKEASRRLKLADVVSYNGIHLTIEKIVEQHSLDFVIEGKWVKSTHF